MLIRIRRVAQASSFQEVAIFSLLSKTLSTLVFFMLVFGLLVKLPMYLFHLWLPRAHVEAPVYGSIVLAAVLLKLGVFGLLKLVPLLAACQIIWGVLPLGLFGGIVIALVRLFQADIKTLIAYSSVAHIILVLGAFLRGSQIGVSGAYLISIFHGVISSGLFYGANILYTLHQSRRLLIIKGRLSLLPLFSFF